MPPSNPRKRVKVVASIAGIDQAERALPRLGFGSKSQFAKSCYVSRDAVSKFFARRGIKLDTFQRICEGLQLSWEEILEPEDPADVSEQKSRDRSVPIGEIATTPSSCSGLENSPATVMQITVLDTQQKVQNVIFLEGDISAVDANFKATMEILLQQQGGHTIKITNIEPGSIRITVQGSPEDIERLRGQITSGELTQLDDFPIQSIEALREELLALSDEAFARTKWEMITSIMTESQTYRDLSGADLSEADLSEANLHGADLRGADLRNTDLSGADLSEANLRGTDLNGANLHGADLSGADLHGANLHGANLRYTLMPNCQGLSHEKIGDFKQRGAVGLIKEKKTKIIENIICPNNSDIENVETSGGVLKLNYTDYGLFLEQVEGSLDEIARQRVMLAVHVGEMLHLEPGRAAFLMPVKLLGLTQFESMIRESTTDVVDLINIEGDDEFVEISLKGTWIATSPNSETGTFITALSPEISTLIYRLWQATTRSLVSARVTLEGRD